MKNQKNSMKYRFQDTYEHIIENELTGDCKLFANTYEMTFKAIKEAEKIEYDQLESVVLKGAIYVGISEYLDKLSKLKKSLKERNMI